MKIVLAVEGPLDIASTLARYRLWGDDPANRIVDDAFLRVLRHAGTPVPYAVRGAGTADDARLEIDVPGARGGAVREAVTAEVRKVFGLDFDVAGFYREAKADPVLAGLAERLYGLRPTLSPRPLEMLVGAITAQQVNLTFAFTLRARLVRRYGTPVDVAGATVHAFPLAASLARARLSELRAMQFSARKAEYVRDLARAAADGALDLEALAGASNGEVIARLTARRGLGRWTADWFMARCLGRADVCPAGDLAVRKAFEHYYGRGRPLSEAAIRRRAARWAGHQTVAVHYLLAGRRLDQARGGGGT